MSDASKNTGAKKWFQGLKAEFHRIIWPDKDTLVKETVTVTVVSIVLGIIIATLDMIIQYGIKFIV